MKHYVPTNRVTGTTYPPVTEEVKAAMENDPHQKGKYTFRETEPEKTIPVKTEPKKEKALAPAPIESRAVTSIPETE